MFKKTFLLTEEEKIEVSEMCGNMIHWVLEGRSIGYMSDKLNLKPSEVEANFEELLYILRKQVGLKRFIKSIFLK